MIFVFFAIVMGSVLYIAIPLIENVQENSLFEQSVDPIQALIDQKDVLLQSIRELDFDFETGKVSAQDYQALRQNIEAQTVTTLKEIERAQKHWAQMEDAQ